MVSSLPHGPAHQLNAWLIEGGVPQHLTNANSIFNLLNSPVVSMEIKL
jgi:hypothetical protein